MVEIVRNASTCNFLPYMWVKIFLNKIFWFLTLQGCVNNDQVFEINSETDW